jgi:hypothetical protein
MKKMRSRDEATVDLEFLTFKPQYGIRAALHCSQILAFDFVAINFAVEHVNYLFAGWRSCIDLAIHVSYVIAV